jgi:8-oxo-dGTP pyrophosphatase MutT (NUDIX family)
MDDPVPDDSARDHPAPDDRDDPTRDDPARSTRDNSSRDAPGDPAPADRPAPGEEYNSGAATRPRQAATVILLRGGAGALEVLLVRRTPAARFMGGVWVFPGGAVDAGDRRAGDDPDEARDDGAHRAAAIRELGEEAAIVLEDSSALVAFSRWITPAEVRIRFDTHFFLAPLPAGQEPRVDGEECVDLGWFTPTAALDAHAAGDIVLVFPTIRHLEQLAPFASADALLAYARSDLVVEPVLPRVIVEGDSARVLLPGEPGY